MPTEQFVVERFKTGLDVPRDIFGFPRIWVPWWSRWDYSNVVLILSNNKSDPRCTEQTAALLTFLVVWTFEAFVVAPDLIKCFSNRTYLFG
jgi:hypothetical protein